MLCAALFLLTVSLFAPQPVTIRVEVSLPTVLSRVRQ